MPSENDKPIIKNLRFELDYKTYSDFYHIGIELLHLKHKHDILKEMMRIIKELKQ